MSTEDRIRDALNAHTPGAVAPDARERIEWRVAAERRRRRVTRLIVGAASVAAMAAAVVLAVGVLRDDGHRMRTIRPATPTTAAVPTTAQLPAEPNVVVGLSDKGRVVVLDIATGRAVRTLADYGDDNAFLGVTVSPDSRFVYYGRQKRNSECTSAEIFSVRLDGSAPPIKFADGAFPSASSDGQWLAYAARPAKKDFGCLNTLTIRSLDGHDQREWRAPEENDGFLYIGGINGITWSPDSRRLAFAFCYEGCGLYLADADRPQPLAELRGLDVHDVEGGATAPAWSNRGIAAMVDCCYEGEPTREPRVVQVDPDDGTTQPLLGGHPSVAWLAWDADGGDLLYATDAHALFLRRADGQTRQLATGFAAAAFGRD